MSARVRIGELLINAGLLTREKLESALERQRTQGAGGRRLGQLLVDLEYVSENQLTKVLSQQLTVPWVSLHHIDFSRQLLNLVPKELAEEFCVIPVYVRHERKAGDTLYLAMEDPTHDDAVRSVMAASGLPVKSMIAAPSDIRAAIRAFYGEPGVPPREESRPLPAISVPKPKTPPPAADVAAAPGRKVPALPPPPPAKPREVSRPLPLVTVNASKKSEAVTLDAEMPTLESTPTREAMPDLEPVEAAFAPDPVERAPSASAPDAGNSVEFADDEDISMEFGPESARASERAPVDVEAPAPANPATASTPPATTASSGRPPAPAINPELPPAPTIPTINRPIRRNAASAGTANAGAAEKKARPRMLALTLLDGTTIQIPAQRRKGQSVAPAAEREPEPPRSPEDRLTSRDLVAALRAVTHGGNPEEILGDARWESLFAALLSLMLKKHLIADWEFVEEWQKM